METIKVCQISEALEEQALAATLIDHQVWDSMVSLSPTNMEEAASVEASVVESVVASEVA
jgi:hypothetical protein